MSETRGIISTHYREDEIFLSLPMARIEKIESNLGMAFTAVLKKAGSNELKLTDLVTIFKIAAGGQLTRSQVLDWVDVHGIPELFKVVTALTKATFGKVKDHKIEGSDPEKK